MRYYIVYPPIPEHGTAIFKHKHNITKRGEFKKEMKGEPYKVEPIGKTEEEMWLRWIVDEYPPLVVLTNDRVKKPEDLAANRTNWRR